MISVLTKEDLVRKYVTQGKSMAAIAKENECSVSYVHKRLKLFAITARTAATVKKKVALTEAFLRRHYTDQGESLSEIAKKCEYSVSGVRYYMEKFGIPLRSSALARAKANALPTEKDVRQLYVEGRKTTREVAHTLKCAPATIRRVMARCGIPSRTASEALKGKPGVPWTDAQRAAREGKYVGACNPNWKDGATKRNYTSRQLPEYLAWRNAVYARDDYTCVACGDAAGGNLRAHHVVNFHKVTNGVDAYAVYNGITFCEDCHAEFHGKYGNFNNNLEQVCLFLHVDTGTAREVFGIYTVKDIRDKQHKRTGPRLVSKYVCMQSVPGAVDGFWGKVTKQENGCWLWAGFRSAGGHGRFSVGDTKLMAHRIAWELEFGPLPPGKNLRHTCGNNCCVCPAHLELCLG